VDNNQDDVYSARHAELEAQFQGLPPAGSESYWRRIEEPDAANRLPLEVLARCFRERHFTDAEADADRIFIVILERVRRRIGGWARSIVAQATSGALGAEDLEQVCDIKLWEELVDEGQTFLLENFMHALRYICLHVGHSEMEKAGEWQRPGVEKSRRVPQGQIDSLHAEPQGMEELPLTERIPDEKAHDEIERANLSDLFDMVERLPRDERVIISDWLSGARTQEETAAKLSVTARTIRNRLKKILDDLRRNYHGGEGDGDD